MIKRVGFIFFSCLLSVVILGYVFRLPITQWYLAPKLKDMGVQLSCLDWSITSELTLHANKICMTYQNQVIELNDIALTKDKIEINSAKLNLDIQSLIDADANKNQGNTRQTNAELLQLSLPSTRQLLHIKSLQINSEQFSQPLMIEIEETQLNQIAVKGDLQANVDLSDTFVSGDIALTQQLFTQIVPNLSNELKNKGLSEFTFTGQHFFKFDGIQLALNSEIALQLMPTYRHCGIQFSSQGFFELIYELNLKQLQLNLNQLNTKAKLDAECIAAIPETAYKNFLVQQLPLNWQVTLPDDINVSREQFSLGLISLTGFDHSDFDNGSQKQNVIQFNVADIAYRLPEDGLGNQEKININQLFNHLSAQIYTQVTTPDIDNFIMKAKISNSEIEGNYQLRLDTLPDLFEMKLKGINSQGQFTLKQVFSGHPVANLSSEINLKNGQFEQLSMKGYSGKLNLSLDKSNFIQFDLTSTLNGSEYLEYQFKKISNSIQTSFELNRLEPLMNMAHVNSTTQVKTIQTDILKLSDISIESKLVKQDEVDVIHNLRLEGVQLKLVHKPFEQTHPFTLNVTKQDTTLLNSILHQFVPLASFTAGQFTGNVTGELTSQIANINGKIENAGMLYGDYLAAGLNTYFIGNYRSGQVNFKPSTFSLDELRTGVEVTNIKGNWQVSQNQASVAQVSADVLGGQVWLDQFNFSNPIQDVRVTVENIDANQLVSLGDKSGISLTGRLNGVLPINISEAGIQIKQGQIMSSGAAKLIISDNAAFDAVKSQQENLKSVLGLLENLDIKQLNSQVELNTDGWVKLGVNLQGFNQAQQQAVNFNYNHEENVYTLLRALRLSDEITKKVEQEYSKKGKKYD